MSEAQLFPVHAVLGARFAQLGEHATAQLADGHNQGLSPQIEQIGRWRVVQQVKSAVHQCDWGLHSKEFGRCKRVAFAVGQMDAMGETEFAIDRLQMGFQLSQSSVKSHQPAIGCGFHA